MPVPYSIKCPCVIEPLQRRHVVAPFDGILAESLVKPGTEVQLGDVLARLEPQEMQWRRGEVDAKQKQAAKRRDAAQAARKLGEAQIAVLEMEKLQAELDQLDDRLQHLEIRSPTNGVVAAGDLQKGIGAPVKIGQSLFEIAPLESLLIELAVPQGEIAWLDEDATVHVRLDSFPSHPLVSKLMAVHPRAECRDAQTVFIAEAPLENEDQRLRPGMSGRGKIDAGWQPLGWVLFHRPWSLFWRTVSWT
jgi:RND family efflux transporter MFP subunit